MVFERKVVALNKVEWILCPVCGNKTRDRIREDTEMKNFPLYCPKCKQESLVDVKEMAVFVHRDKGKEC